MQTIQVIHISGVHKSTFMNTCFCRPDINVEACLFSVDVGHGIDIQWEIGLIVHCLIEKLKICILIEE